MEIPDNLTTNAGVLEEGQPLTKEQILALAKFEDWWCEMGWRMHGHGSNPMSEAENVLHQFICNKLGDCVCSNTQDVDDGTKEVTGG